MSRRGWLDKGGRDLNHGRWIRLNSVPDIPLRRMAQAVRVGESGVKITSYYGLEVSAGLALICLSCRSVVVRNFRGRWAKYTQGKMKGRKLD